MQEDNRLKSFLCHLFTKQFSADVRSALKSLPWNNLVRDWRVTSRNHMIFCNILILVIIKRKQDNNVFILFNTGYHFFKD